jgi:hypothetical protein
MSAHLVIHKGPAPYWWNSPDIWIVPGTNPNGAPGSPIAGKPAYLWAQVSNTGDAPANGTRIDFYWADPSAQVVVGVATQIGSAFVDLAPGDTQDVLCLVPWVPKIVNGGHECVLAVAHAPGDTNPIPDPLPNGFPFDPPSHDQIAQLNVTVLAASMRAALLSMNVSAIGRNDAQARVSVEYGREVDTRLLARLGIRDLHPAQKRSVDVSLSLEPYCGDRPDPHGKRQLDVHVPRGTWVPVFVAIHATDLGHNEYQLVHVVERQAEKIVGGVSYLVVNRP